MDTQDIIRATFDRRAARAQDTLSSKYVFETPIIEVDGEYYHQLTITRMADGTVVHQQNYSTVEALDDAISDWRVALGISHLSTAMMGL